MFASIDTQQTRGKTMNRRLFLKHITFGGGLAAVCGVGLLIPYRLPAATIPDDVFTADSESTVLHSLFGDLQPVTDERIHMDIPYLAMRGRGVDLKTWADMDDVDTIAIITAGNTHPLNTCLLLSGAKPYFSSRIRVEQSSAVSAYFRAGSALYSTTRHIKITAGGYGTNFNQP
jgi:sulfur-oxidizing protein SoxY